MRTAVDTNVFSRILLGSETAARAERALWKCSADGVVVISPIVYAEMLANPMLSREQVDAVLSEAGIRIEYSLLPAVWSEAGRRFGAYALRRRASGGSEAKRLVADMVVGAHALLQAERLLTFDRRRYTIDFPELELVNVEAAEV